MVLYGGSRAFERFTGPQIRKVYETQEDVYYATERVSLVSSFMASLLVGEYVAIDHSDGAGMNLMDLHHRTWSPDALQVSPPSHMLFQFVRILIASSILRLKASRICNFCTTISFKNVE